jgi:hypothetical protein
VTTEEQKQLLKRARYHEQLAAAADEPEHAAMHQRLAGQLRGFVVHDGSPAKTVTRDPAAGASPQPAETSEAPRPAIRRVYL